MVVPAVTGTLNLLKICSQLKVRRVVVVSSGGAVAMNPNWPSDKEKDETCWSDKEYCKSTGVSMSQKSFMYMYFSSINCLSSYIQNSHCLGYIWYHSNCILFVCNTSS